MKCILVVLLHFGLIVAHSLYWESCLSTSDELLRFFLLFWAHYPTDSTVCRASEQMQKIESYQYIEANGLQFIILYAVTQSLII